MTSSNPYAPPTATPAVPDPFDVASLRLTGDFAAAKGVKKALLTIPIRKPDKAWFVRVRPGDDYSLSTCVIELKEDRETYLVAPHLRAELAGESTLKAMALFTAINAQGVLFLWPAKLPGADGRIDEWSRSGLEAAKMAETSWVRVQSNMSLGAYEVFTAIGERPEPEWPERPFGDLLRIAFKDKLIDSMDHTVLRKLRGEL